MGEMTLSSATPCTQTGFALVGRPSHAHQREYLTCGCIVISGWCGHDGPHIAHHCCLLGEHACCCVGQVAGGHLAFLHGGILQAGVSSRTRVSVVGGPLVVCEDVVGPGKLPSS